VEGSNNDVPRTRCANNSAVNRVPPQFEKRFHLPNIAPSCDGGTMQHQVVSSSVTALGLYSDATAFNLAYSFLGLCAFVIVKNSRQDRFTGA